MRRSLVILAVFTAATARAQVRVELSAVRPAVSGTVAVPAAIGVVPSLAPELTAFAAPSFSPASSAGAAPAADIAAPVVARIAPAAPALAALPAASMPTIYLAPGDLPATPAHVEAVAPAPLPAAHPRDWQFHTWTPPAKEDASLWKFRDWPFFSRRLWDGEREAAPLGEGVMGSVFVHPSRPDAIVKMARRGYADAAGDSMAPSDETVLAYEDYDLDRLAALDAAPRTLARVEVSGRPGSVRERIYGETVASLKRRGAFGARERRRVDELIARIADGGFVARDMNLGNIMIGRKGDDFFERAYLVDALGVHADDALDADGRRAQMLAQPVPWLAWQGFGVSRPLSRMLDDAQRPLGFSVDRTPLAWPKWKRWTALAATLGTLAVAPALAHAGAVSPLGLGLLPSWGMLAAVAAFIGVAGIPLRLFAHRLAPWVMTRSKDEGADMLRKGPLRAVPELFVGAAAEEFLFRCLAFVALTALLHAALPLVPAMAVASFLSSLGFALVHGYGSVWTRVIGGMLYAGAFMVSGTLLLPIAAHFAFNLSLYLYGRYLNG